MIFVLHDNKNTTISFFKIKEKKNELIKKMLNHSQIVLTKVLLIYRGKKRKKQEVELRRDYDDNAYTYEDFKSQYGANTDLHWSNAEKRKDPRDNKIKYKSRYDTLASKADFKTMPTFDTFDWKNIWKKADSAMTADEIPRRVNPFTNKKQTEEEFEADFSDHNKWWNKAETMLEAEAVCPVCETDTYDSKGWIGCNKCSKWFHIECVGLSQKDAESTSSFICPNCAPKKRGRPPKNLSVAPAFTPKTNLDLAKDAAKDVMETLYNQQPVSHVLAAGSNAAKEYLIGPGASASMKIAWDTLLLLKEEEMKNFPVSPEDLGE